jgi:cell wall-associated NlpC family hydrolase
MTVRWAVVSAGLGVLLAAGGCAKAVLTPEDYAGAPPVRPPIDQAAVSSRNAAAARMATRYLGAPYVWAGSSPAGFDCSGLVSYVYAQVGVSIPHNAAQQYRFGTPVPREQLEPGDLVFFNRLRHNGIYLGDGRFIHATRPGGVKIARLDDDWFRTRWVGARRL